MLGKPNRLELPKKFLKHTKIIFQMTRNVMITRDWSYGFGEH